MEESYTLKPTTPCISPADGTTAPPPLYVTFTCSSPDSGVIIYYTTDGRDPTPSDNDGSVSPGDSVEIPENPGTTKTWKVRAIAHRTNWTDSNPTTTHTITVTSTVATPSIEWINNENPDKPDTFISKGHQINFTCSDNDAALRYTLDGSAPISSSLQGSSVTIRGYRTTVKVRAFKNNWTPSAVETETFHIPIYKSSVNSTNFGSSFNWYDRPQYNDELDRYFHATYGALGNPDTFYRYSASGDLEASDDSINFDGYVLNDDKVILYNGTSTTEYTFNGSSLSATGETGPIHDGSVYAEGEDYFYQMGSGNNIYVFYKSNLNLYRSDTITDISGTDLIVAYWDGTNTDYLFVGDSDNNKIS